MAALKLDSHPSCSFHGEDLQQLHGHDGPAMFWPHVELSGREPWQVLGRIDTCRIR
jgi:hypothetical protein